jgi:sulfite reductase (NADPH) flavoprotein alpha-component
MNAAMKATPIAEHTSPLNAEQVEQLNRLIETLTPMQATWISGYLVGLNASVSEGAVQQPQSQAIAAPAAGEAATLTILYGSETGNAEGVSEDLKAAAEAKGFAVSLYDMGDYKPKGLKKEKNLIIVTATHGEGDPPDNAEELYEFLHGKKAPKLDGVKFAVLALGDLSYEHFCQTGKDFDTRLAELGAERVHGRIDCDVDYEEEAEKFIGGVLEVLGEELETAGESHPTVTPMPGAAPATAAGDAWTRKNPFRAEVLTNIVLNGRGSQKEVRHIELDVEDSGLSWEPGDSLGIISNNDPKVVDELIGVLALDPDESVTGVDGEVALREALTRQYEITTLTRPFIEKYAQLAGSKKLDALLADGARDELAAYVDGRHVVDLVEDFPVKGLAGNDFVRLLRKLPPRLYSIASSHRANPDEVHLTVAAVRYETHGRKRGGVASTELADRIGEDGSVPVYVDRNKNFRLPAGPETPVIMIGPGTGVAPFRAFLEEREELGAGGRNWLFFGAQHFLTDFYYQTDWLRWRKGGLLTRVDVAFSRDRDEKVYVQHRLRERARDVYAWLEEGAHLYVCGDADAMAHDVHEALIEVVAQQGGLGGDKAADYIKRLQKENRYQRDVY